MHMLPFDGVDPLGGAGHTFSAYDKGSSSKMYAVYGAEEKEDSCGLECNRSNESHRFSVWGECDDQGPLQRVIPAGGRRRGLHVGVADDRM